jgi:hypothetical protein
MKRFCCQLCLLLLPFGADAQSVDLRYDAYVGPAHAGVINVQLEVDQRAYSVYGQARAKGLLELIKDTRGWFSARGRMAAGEPQLDVYEYFQKDNSKERFVSVAGGQLRYVKDGKARPAAPVHPGLDLVTALWVSADCRALRQVHTGRSAYEFRFVEQEAGVCRFVVQEVDEDEEPFELDVAYGERAGLRVPLSIQSTGGWAGRIVLIE